MAEDVSVPDPVGVLVPTSQVTGATTDRSLAQTAPGSVSQGADTDRFPFVHETVFDDDGGLLEPAAPHLPDPPVWKGGRA
jgi:hypothetical protein